MPLPRSLPFEFLPVSYVLSTLTGGSALLRVGCDVWHPFSRTITQGGSLPVYGFFKTSCVANFLLVGYSVSFHLADFFIPAGDAGKRLNILDVLSVLLVPVLLCSTTSLIIDIVFE